MPEPKTKMCEIREKAGLSILRLSKMASVHYNQAWLADHGHKGVSIAVKKKIAAALGLPVGQVFPEIIEGLHQLQMFVAGKD